MVPRRVQVRLNLHGVVSVENAQQIEEEEYEETVKKTPAAAAAKACAPTGLCCHCPVTTPSTKSSTFSGGQQQTARSRLSRHKFAFPTLPVLDAADPHQQSLLHLRVDSNKPSVAAFHVTDSLCLPFLFWTLHAVF